MDTVLTILQGLLDYYARTGSNEIRRRDLKERCDAVLFKESNGQQDSYGGSFQRGLDYLTGEMALACLKRGRRLTLVKFDIRRVKRLLFNRKYGPTATQFSEQEISPNIWEKIVEEEMERKIEERTKNIPGFNEKVEQFYLPIKQLLLKHGSYLASGMYGLYMKHDNKKFELSEEIALHLMLAAYMIASKNQRDRFSLLIDYTGRPETDAELGPMYAHGLFKNFIPKYFAQWTLDNSNSLVSEEDLQKLAEIKIDALSPKTKMLWDFFYNCLEAYWPLYTGSSRN
ncbi:MAG: hypothetical protein M3Y53_10500 [Thermoproteota archaeon]|nr:hypothetical protein [Thermoproteota archaeon]